MAKVNPDLDWAICDTKGRLPDLRLFKQYDEGDHRLAFATDKFRSTFGSLFVEFADNLCDDVVDAITDRLQITAWSANDDTLAQAVSKAWTRNRGEARMGSVHRHAFRDGDGYAIVQESATDGRARIWKQDPRQIAVQWSTEDPDEMAVAARIWKVGTRYRINLMYPDRVERYASAGQGAGGGIPGAASFKLLTAGDPLLKNDEAVQEQGSIPLFHFPNGDVSCYGRSLLVPVIPLQDALNKALADMLVAMEFHAYPQRWATGITPKVDPATGQEIDPFKAGEGRVWWTGKDTAQFGQFDPALMEGFLAVQSSFRLEIARKGAMPAFDLHSADGGTPPSGVALLVAEGRTVKMGKDRIRDWTPEDKRMMAAVASIDLKTQVDADDLDCQWAPVETRDVLALLNELALKKDLGVPTEQILEEMGYSPEQVIEFMGQAEADGEAAQIASAVLTGGRASVLMAGAQTVAEQLGVPSAPAAPAGGSTPLAS
jgi:hypothetical protein